MAPRTRNWMWMNLELLEMVLQRRWRAPLTIQDTALRNDQLPEVDWEVSKKVPF